MATPRQIGMIHGLAKRAGLDDDGYRDMLRATAGVASSRDLTTSGAQIVIDRLRVLTGDAPDESRARPPARGALKLSGRYIGKFRALWLTAWNLGLAASPADTALAAFVGRQTGLDSPSWVRDPKDAAKAIEGLKAWIARDGGLTWPRGGDVRDIKWTLVRRQWDILIERGRPVETTKWGDLAAFASRTVADGRSLDMKLGGLGETDLDRLAAELGRMIRKGREGRR